MARYLVKFSELKTKNENERRLIEQIEQCKNNIASAKLKLDWEGPAKEKFMITLDYYVNELNVMIEKLKACVNVTDSFYNNFSDGYNNIKKGFANLQDEMVNTWKIQK